MQRRVNRGESQPEAQKERFGGVSPVARDKRREAEESGEVKSSADADEGLRGQRPRQQSERNNR